MALTSLSKSGSGSFNGLASASIAFLVRVMRTMASSRMYWLGVTLEPSMKRAEPIAHTEMQKQMATAKAKEIGPREWGGLVYKAKRNA